MRHLFGLFCLVIFASDGNSQTSVVSTGSFNRSVPKVGFNLNSLTKPTWQNSSFLDSVKALHPQLIRYPGGTESQYFDWQAGGIISQNFWTSGQLFNHGYLSTVPQVPHTLTQLLYLYQQSGIKPVFCLNMLTKSLSDQLLMLKTADSLGIPIEFIELGNELYFTDQDFVNKYPQPVDYVLDIKNNWIPALDSLYPNALISVIGSYSGSLDLNNNPVPARISTWNDTLLARNPGGNAFTFHYYIPPNTTTFLNPNITQALAAPFRHWPTFKANTINLINNGMECWITEYNLSDGNLNNYAIASSWAHGLYTASFFSLMLEEPKISMLLNHQITGSPAFASLASYTLFGDTISNRMTAEGNAMRLIHKAIGGNQSATKLQFSLNPMITVGPTNYPSLIGWKFENGSNKEFIFLNLSGTTFQLDLASLQNASLSYEQITAANPLQLNLTTQNLSVIKGSFTNTLSVAPYSLTYGGPPQVQSTNEELAVSEKIDVFPNPASSEMTVRVHSDTEESILVEIFGTDGKKVFQKSCILSSGELSIKTASFAPGLYLINLDSEKGWRKQVKIQVE
jgi:hypothetical protein